MKKHAIQRNKLALAKETIRQLVPVELEHVAGGMSCSLPTATACDCSGGSHTDTDGTIYCTRMPI